MGLPLEVGEQIFDLQVGDLSQPLLVREHYEIFKVLSQGPAPTHYRAAFLREQYWNEFRTRWDELIVQLKDRLNAQLDGEAIRLLVDRMAESDGRGMLLGPEEQEVILCRFKGGQVTLLDFAETYNAYWFIRSVSFDSSGIAEFIHRDLLPRSPRLSSGVAGRLGPRFDHRGLVAGQKKIAAARSSPQRGSRRADRSR